jgi:hypothetical protein
MHCTLRAVSLSNGVRIAVESRVRMAASLSRISILARRRRSGMMKTPMAATHLHVRGNIADVARQLGLTTKSMPSGAGQFLLRHSDIFRNVVAFGR